MREPDILSAGIVPPNYQMMRLRDMLDADRIAWEDRSDELSCRTQQLDEDGKIVFSAVCGRYAYGEIELWTASMIAEKTDPVGLATAEEALRMIRSEVGA
jgi:hypothetical protein